MKKRLTKKTIAIIAIAAVIIVAMIGFFTAKRGKKQEVKIETVRCRIDSVEVTVTATGEVQPVYKVEVGTQVSGIVEKIHVDFNSQVKKGQLLAELDRSNLNEQLTQAQTIVSNAKSNLTMVQQQYDRIKALYDNKAATQEAYETAVNSLNQAKNQLKTAQSELSRAQTNLSYATIYSPIDGIIMNKAVEEGQTVASAFSTPTLFTIANDLKQMQVEAAVDEADIGGVKAGQRVTFTVDAFPDDVFQGTVKEVRINPTVTSNVVTYTVIINAPNPEEKLFPGMTASVSIVTKKECGPTIPLQSFFVNIDPATQKQLEKKGFTFKGLYNGQRALTEGLKDVSKKTVWIKRGEKNFEQINVRSGLNNGVNTLVEGLNEGDEVISEINELTDPMNNDKKGGNPFMPRHPQEKKR